MTPDAKPGRLIPMGAPAADPGPKRALERRRILVVDDSPVVRRIVAMKLKAHGYEVMTAEDGASAVGAARNLRPDLILLDLNFPPDVGSGGGVPWDGFLIMKWLRQLENAKDIPIIIITGTDPKQVADRAREAGAVTFFQKPMDSDELLAAIGRTLLAAVVGTPQQAAGRASSDGRARKTKRGGLSGKPAQTSMPPGPGTSRKQKGSGLKTAEPGGNGPWPGIEKEPDAG